MIWAIQRGLFAPKFLHFHLDIGPEILTIITLPLNYIILWKVSGKMLILVFMPGIYCQTALLPSCLDILLLSMAAAFPVVWDNSVNISGLQILADVQVTKPREYTY